VLPIQCTVIGAGQPLHPGAVIGLRPIHAGVVIVHQPFGEPGAAERQDLPGPAQLAGVLHLLVTGVAARLVGTFNEARIVVETLPDPPRLIVRGGHLPVDP